MFEGLFPIWLNIILLVGGLTMITFAADKFVDSAVIIARYSGLPKMIIGATIISLGTTLPEFSVMFLGGFFDRAPTAMGGAIGSTICNIGLIMGLCVLLRPIFAQRRLYWQHGLVMILSGIMAVILSLDGVISIVDSLIITGGLALYIFLSIKIMGTVRDATVHEPDEIDSASLQAVTPDYSLKKAVVLFVIGSLGVAVGATLIVENAAIVARWIGIPELVIGLTLVALGTSLPELVTCLTATRKRHGEIAVGNIIGANILDILWVLGIGALSFNGLEVERQTLVLDYPVMLTAMLLLVIFGFFSRHLHRWQGGIILSVYIVYLTVMFIFFT